MRSIRKDLTDIVEDYDWSKANGHTNEFDADQLASAIRRVIRAIDRGRYEREQ